MNSLSPVPDFEMTVKKIPATNSPPHRHRYFEIICVLNGCGQHMINDNRFDYTKGDLFLLTPQDLHTFMSDVPGEFCIVDFTGSFFHS